MEKKTKPINDYNVEKCDCSEDDNCACPFYDDVEKTKPKNTKSSKTTCSTKTKSNKKS